MQKIIVKIKNINAAMKLSKNWPIAALMAFSITGLITTIYIYTAVYFPSAKNQDTIVNIKKGTSIWRIGKLLAQKNLVNNSYVFVLSTKFILFQPKLHYGEYLIPARSTMNEIVDIMAKGAKIRHNITFAEGMSSWQIVEQLKNDDRLDKVIATIPAEGSLMPETYSFTRSADRNEIIRLMRAAQQKFIKDNWHKKQNNLPYKTRREVVILASIVEKETGIAAERTKIAGVFSNRLRKGIRLQSDPTVIYGITKGKAKLGRGLFKSELKKKNPYNTYTIKGLPKSPIANPGKASILAVLQPAKTKALYFVSSGNGGHHFSNTYLQHRKYVKALRKREKNDPKK